MPTAETKHFKVALYEAMEQTDPQIIVHLSIQAAIDEAPTPAAAYLALHKLQHHVMQANIAVLEYLMAQEQQPFPRRKAVKNHNRTYAGTYPNRWRNLSRYVGEPIQIGWGTYSDRLGNLFRQVGEPIQIG